MALTLDQEIEGSNPYAPANPNLVFEAPACRAVRLGSGDPECHLGSDHVEMPGRRSCRWGAERSREVVPVDLGRPALGAVGRSKSLERRWLRDTLGAPLDDQVEAGQRYRHSARRVGGEIPALARPPSRGEPDPIVDPECADARDMRLSFGPDVDSQNDLGESPSPPTDDCPFPASRRSRARDQGITADP